MYTKEESARLRQAFWTAFGQYMALVPSAEGEKINWLNYKTGIRHLSFKTDADRDGALIAVMLTHPDADTQQQFYDQLLASKKMLETETGEAWVWQPPAPDEHGKIISSVSCRLDKVNVFRRDEWHAIISFLKPRLVALDAWWQMAKPGFEMIG